ncbi:MAG: hypothetical protein DRI94_14805, partial [Bacteroidetes bacterium]
INLKQKTKYPKERWLSRKRPYYSPKKKFYLEKSDENMTKKNNDFKKYMAKQKAVDNEDDC